LTDFEIPGDLLGRPLLYLREKDKDRKNSGFYRFSAEKSEECDISLLFATGNSLCFSDIFGILKFRV